MTEGRGQSQREGDRKVEAEIRMMQPQAWKRQDSHLELAEARTDSPLEPLEGAWPCWISAFRLAEL